MPSTSPIVGDNPYGDAPAPAPGGESSERVRRLEGELADLRDTVARFAEMMIGEVKELRSSRAETGPTPPAGATDAPVEPIADPAVEPARRPWLLMELIRDFGASLRMYLDPRYRVRRSTQMLVPLLLAIFVLNYVFFHHLFVIPVLSPLLEKLADIVLAVLVYKVISRELIRYRQVLLQLQAWQGPRRARSTVIFQGDPPTTQLETE